MSKHNGKRKPGVRYNVFGHDEDWWEVLDCRQRNISAHEMIVVVELWNQLKQRHATDIDHRCMSLCTVDTLGIEV